MRSPAAPRARAPAAAAALLLAALAAPGAAGAGTSAAPPEPPRPPDLVVWHAYDPQKSGLDKVVAAYNARQGAAQPHVRLVRYDFDGFADRVSAAVPRGKGPDVFIYPQDRLGGWVEAGGIIDPVEPWADAATRLRHLPVALRAMTYGNALQGLPISFKVMALWYNRRLVPQPPRTSAELAAMALRATRRDVGQYGLVYPYADYYYHAALQNGFGGRVFDERGQPALDCPENLRAMELLRRWIDDFLPAEPPSPYVTQELFNQGKAAMILSGPWFVREVNPGVDWGLATLPVLSEAGDQPMRPWMTVEGMFVAAGGRQKEAAHAFVAWATGPEAARLMAAEGAHLPAERRALEDPAVAANPYLRVFLQEAAVAVPMPNLQEMAAMWSPATTALGAVVRRTSPPAAALGRAQQDLARALAAQRARRASP